MTGCMASSYLIPQEGSDGALREKLARRGRAAEIDLTGGCG